MISRASDFIAIAIVALLLSFIVGCRSNRSIPGVGNIRAQCSAQSDNDYYFPVRTFSTVEGSGSELNYEYGGYLAEVGEPSLSCGPGPDEAYRIVWTHAFRPDPVVIGISRTGDKYTVTAYDLKASEGTAVKIVSRTEKRLGSEQWHTLTAAVEQANFFFMPVWHIRKPSDLFVLDGANWVLEGRIGSSYHAILRGSDEEGAAAFKEFCRLFFQCAPLLAISVGMWPRDDRPDQRGVHGERRRSRRIFPRAFTMCSVIRKVGQISSKDNIWEVDFASGT